MTDLDGVEGVAIDFENKLVTVTCDDTFDVEEAIAALAEAGFANSTVQEDDDN